MPEEKIINLPVGDSRAEALYVEILNFVNPRLSGLPITTVMGIMELVKLTVIESCVAKLEVHYDD